MNRNIIFTIFVILLSINYIHGASINQRSAQQPAAFVDDSSQHFGGQWGQMEFISEEMKLFAVRGHCRDACARACKPIMLADTDQVFFICPQIKPPEKSIPEKLFAKVSFPVMLLVGVITFALLICLVCCCRSMCCSSSTSRSSHSSRDLLNQRHINDITDNGGEFEKQPLPTSSIEDNQTPPFVSKTLRSTRVQDV
uniref:Uncharacterized protein n=1 Tax=Panagrolaimus sp. PS1159 TaxID=55785 RepID=A0AC35EYX1_9BILA